MPVLAWEEENQQGLHEILQQTDKNICLIVGPEGGFEKSEVDLAIQNSARIVSLGNHIFTSRNGGNHVCCKYDILSVGEEYEIL